MKKTVFIIISFLIFVSVIIFAFLNFQKKASISIPPFDEADTDADVLNQANNETTQGIKSVWLKVNDKDKLFLFSNLDNKLPSKELATKNSCLHIISGGFYDTSGKHIGLLVSEGEIISESRENSLFNAYFSISKSGDVSITEYPVFTPRISLQTGPFLLKKSIATNLSLERDENARRMAVGIDKNKDIYFFAFYDQTNTFSGPKLAELPGIVDQINKERKLNLTDVINLDGGAHSAFLSDLSTLSEASPIGSYFCIKP